MFRVIMLSISMFSVIMLNVIMYNVIMLSAVMLSVAAPLHGATVLMELSTVLKTKQKRFFFSKK